MNRPVIALYSDISEWVEEPEMPYRTFQQIRRNLYMVDGMGAHPNLTRAGVVKELRILLEELERDDDRR